MSQGQGFKQQQSGKAKSWWWAGGIAGAIALGFLFVTFILPVLFFTTIFAVGSGTNAIVGEENMPYAKQRLEGITKAVAKFTPQTSWTEISDTGVHSPAKCTDKDTSLTPVDCEMFRGVWDTKEPYSKENFNTVINSFGGPGIYGKIDEMEKKCVRTEVESPLSCDQTTYVSMPGNNSFSFKVHLVDKGPNTNVIVTVTHNRRG